MCVTSQVRKTAYAKTCFPCSEMSYPSDSCAVDEKSEKASFFCWFLVKKKKEKKHTVMMYVSNGNKKPQHPGFPRGPPPWY